MSSHRQRRVDCPHSMPQQNRDTKVRLRAFSWLNEVSQAYEEILSEAMLQRGFPLGVKSRSLSSGNR